MTAGAPSRAVAGGGPPGSPPALPILRDGKLRINALARWAAEFDALDERRYTAADFVEWVRLECREVAVLRRERDRVLATELRHARPEPSDELSSSRCA